MDKAQKIRWSCLLTALSLTIGAIFYPTEPNGELSSAVVEPSRRLLPAVAASSTTFTDASGIWIATDADPFAPRSWQPAPVVVEAPKAPVVSELAKEVEAPPPPLPYKFMGEMNDGNDRVVYLGRGENVLLARVGDVLESSYRVVGIGTTQIDFESLPSGVKQSLVIPVRDN
jgi:hypothetical protein